VFCLSGCKDHDAKVPKMVFAHYMVAVPTAGAGSGVEDYKREILEAQARGIDGFALNCGGWLKKEPHYKDRVNKIYQAAQELDSGFSLFLSADFATGLTDEEFIDMVESYRNHPNQLKVEDKPVLSTWASSARHTALIQSEFTGDRSVFFVPFIYPRPANELPTDAEIEQVFHDHKSADGFFYFGAAGKPEELDKVVRATAQKWKSEGKLFMAPVTPFYRGYAGNYRVFETRGFEGLALAWKSAIESGADWIEIVTWNDWGESSYIAPHQSVDGRRFWGGHWGAVLSHTGYLDLSKYFIEWFKTGQPPAIKEDTVFYAYRLHAKTIPSYTNPKNIEKSSLSRPRGAQDLIDAVYAAVLLTAPATLEIELAGNTSRFDLPAGFSQVQVPMQSGIPVFRLLRDDKVVVEKSGELEISPDNVWGNFNYFVGSTLPKSPEQAPNENFAQPKTQK
jgi:hypothetical protein